jgi:predicted nucleotidyltransferase
MTPTLAHALAARLAAVASIVVAYLFGSQARGGAGPRFDVDAAVLSDRVCRQLGQLDDLAGFASGVERHLATTE